MQRNHYSTEFKEQALRKAQARGIKTLAAIANELNLSLGTLKNWLKQSSKGIGLAAPTSGPAGQWNAAQRLSLDVGRHNEARSGLSACASILAYGAGARQQAQSQCCPESRKRPCKENGKGHVA